MTAAGFALKQQTVILRLQTVTFLLYSNLNKLFRPVKMDGNLVMWFILDWSIVVMLGVETLFFPWAKISRDTFPGLIWTHSVRTVEGRVSKQKLLTLAVTELLCLRVKEKDAVLQLFLALCDIDVTSQKCTGQMIHHEYCIWGKISKAWCIMEQSNKNQDAP